MSKKQYKKIVEQLQTSESKRKKIQKQCVEKLGSSSSIQRWQNNLAIKDILDTYLGAHVDRKLEIFLKKSITQLMKKIQNVFNALDEKQKALEQRFDWLTDREKALKMKDFDRPSVRINQSNETEDIREYPEKKLEKMIQKLARDTKISMREKVQVQEQYKNNFLIRENTIRVEKYNDWTQIKLNVVIPKESTFRLFTRIAETKNCSIMIGIANKLADKKYLWDSGKAICYFGRDGNIWYSENQKSKFQKSGKGFQQKDIIITEVNMREGKIKWIINGKTIEKGLGQLKNQECVPFWDLKDRHDTIEWLIQ